MNKEQRERRNTFILFVLMFIAINYGLFTFVIEPKIKVLDDVKASYQREGENQSVKDSLLTEVNELEEAIVQLKTRKDSFDDLTMKNYDTIDFAYDFYDFCQQLGIEGVNATLSVGVIQPYIQANKLAAEAEANPVEERDPDMYADIDGPVMDQVVVEDLELKEVYVQLPMEVMLYFPTGMTAEVVEAVENMTSNNIFIQSILLDVTEATRTVGEEEITEAYTSLLISFNAYAAIESLSDDIKMNYTFYESQQTYDDLSMMFDPGVSNDDEVTGETLEEEPQNTETGE